MYSKVDGKLRIANVIEFVKQTDENKVTLTETTKSKVNRASYDVTSLLLQNVILNEYGGVVRAVNRDTCRAHLQKTTDFRWSCLHDVCCCPSASTDAKQPAGVCRQHDRSEKVASSCACRCRTVRMAEPPGIPTLGARTPASVTATS